MLVTTGSIIVPTGRGWTERFLSVPTGSIVGPTGSISPNLFPVCSRYRFPTGSCSSLKPRFLVVLPVALFSLPVAVWQGILWTIPTGSDFDATGSALTDFEILLTWQRPL